MALRGDQLFLSYGVMGGFMQPQGHIQVLLNILRGMPPQAALDAPRFCISAGSPDSEIKDSGSKAGDINSEVYIEDGIPASTLDSLRGAWEVRSHNNPSDIETAMGHDARPCEGIARMLMGRGQVIQRLTDPSGRLVWAAGSDLRADGHAAAQI
jgi:gamma-glutamyltranspeptidase/glutathione hydrolase